MLHEELTILQNELEYRMSAQIIDFLAKRKEISKKRLEKLSTTDPDTLDAEQLRLFSMTLRQNIIMSADEVFPSPSGDGKLTVVIDGMHYIV